MKQTIITKNHELVKYPQVKELITRICNKHPLRKYMTAVICEEEDGCLVICFMKELQEEVNEVIK